MSFFDLAGTVLKSLFSKPATRLYPFEKRQAFQNTRGSISIEINKCIFCSLCQRKCPTAALVVARDKKTWEIDRLACIACGFCVEVCPTKCLHMEQQYAPAVAAKGPRELHNA